MDEPDEVVDAELMDEDHLPALRPGITEGEDVPDKNKPNTVVAYQTRVLALTLLCLNCVGDDPEDLRPLTADALPAGAACDDCEVKL
jgi:hypothetical protein